MMIYKNLAIIGTSHVSKKSISEINKAFSEDSFSVVAIELDRNRLYALLHPDEKNERFSFSMLRKIGLKGFLFAMIGRYVQQKIGKNLGIKPGSDMLEAYLLAKEKGCDIKLVDENLEVVLKRISKELTFKEKLRFIRDIFYSLFFPKQYAKKYNLENIDLSSVPEQELIDLLLVEMKKEYPTIYKVLVEDRNHLMAKRIYSLMNSNYKVLAVVGAGHKKEIKKIIEELFSKNTDVI